MEKRISRNIEVPEGSTLSVSDYEGFLQTAAELLGRFPQYFATGEDINSIELAHLTPSVPETMIAIYVGINDAVCNKGLVTPFLVNHAHNNIFVFDPEVFPGGDAVPSGTVDMPKVLKGFEPPNETWDTNWTYVAIADPARATESLWRENGYIDMIPAKFEDFTMLSDARKSSVCIYIDPKAFDHPVNKIRDYLTDARRRGDKHAPEFTIPEKIAADAEGLAPVILNMGEKLYVANGDSSPCAHAWSNLHPDNEEYAVVNENSAVPLEMVVRKPRVNPTYAESLRPALGSADMTTDCFLRGHGAYRKPLLVGTVKG